MKKVIQIGLNSEQKKRVLLAFSDFWTGTGRLPQK